MMDGFIEKISDELARLKSSGQFRTLRQTAVLSGGRAELDGRVYLNFSGNDYLGVAGDVELRREFYRRYADDLPLPAATGSRLLGGDTPAHEQLEATISRLYGASALVFNSGYHANIGILPALTGRDDAVFSDKLNHASIIDGLRLCECKFRRYPHLDYDRLEAMLDEAWKEGRRSFIVSESVFSMDGDTADIPRLIELKKRYHAVLVIDEAHSVGVRGRDGLGMCAGFTDDVDVIVGTFGKAFGSAGAYCVTSPPLRDYLINFMRPFIFSTALPPVVALWSDFVLNRTADFAARRRRLAAMGGRVRAAVAAAGLRTLGDSQIVPAIVGENAPALALAEKMRAAGLLVFAVRPPTVPAGSSRLRFSLSAALPEETPELIAEALK
ncbi:MAG: 8-amino-7-oxononanoate synthase [Victivallaceae bacterium]|nr:8-amino-7-oxononanoate synthase [Victivallaceae bacterium]